MTTSIAGQPSIGLSLSTSNGDQNLNLTAVAGAGTTTQIAGNGTLVANGTDSEQFAYQNTLNIAVDDDNSALTGAYADQVAVDLTGIDTTDQAAVAALFEKAKRDDDEPQPGGTGNP